MAFVQIIDMHIAKFDEVNALEEECAPRPRAAHRRIVARDRNDAEHYVVPAFFDSYESAMTNSNLAETSGIGERQAALLDGPMQFTDLDVVKDQAG